MCLKYFVEHTLCEHHEYLGSHYCSNTPCDLGIQHFHYIDDDFPVPVPPKLQQKSIFEQGALSCNTCTIKHRNKLDPDEVPVKHFPPTNDFNVEETRPTGYFLPIKVIRVDKGDLKQYNFDYKSLSDADEEEWNAVEKSYETGKVDVTYNKHATQKKCTFVQGQVVKQLSNLPNYLELRQQDSSLMQSDLTPEAYVTGNYLHCPTPHVAFLEPSPILSITHWHGSTPAPSSAQTVPLPLRPSKNHPSAMQLHAMNDTVEQKTPATTLESPTIAVPTMTIHPPSIRTMPPFVIGNLTDAYLRMEAAKRRHMRERTRRARSSLRDVLPPRSISLADCMVKNKKNRKRPCKDVDAAENIDTHTWSTLSFKGEGLDSEAEAEGFTEKNGSEKKRCGFSCRLVTLM